MAEMFKSFTWVQLGEATSVVATSNRDITLDLADLNTEKQHTLQHDVSKKLAFFSPDGQLLFKLTVLYCIWYWQHLHQRKIMTTYSMCQIINKTTNMLCRFSLCYPADTEVSTVKTHPFVPGVVTVSNISDGPGRVQIFGVFNQGPGRKTEQKLHCKFVGITMLYSY